MSAASCHTAPRTSGSRCRDYISPHITVRTHAATPWAWPNVQAEQARCRESRFLAAASHDLRQAAANHGLLQGSLTKVIEGDSARKLLTRLDQALKRHVRYAERVAGHQPDRGGHSTRRK